MADPRFSAAPSATVATRLRGDAERAAGSLPPLLAAAERLSATVLMGAHGRRQAGPGETFWQYRRAGPGDAAGAIDWRRSGRGDALFVRETEWEQPQTVWFWCDRSRAMTYRSARRTESKGERAALLCAALAVLLTRGGERIAAAGSDARQGADRAKAGPTQLSRVVSAFASEGDDDFGRPPRVDAARGGRAVFASDFFGDLDAVEREVARLAAGGVSGLMAQITDPAEESFPFDGRVVFESMAGALRFDAHRAQSLRENYQAALEARRARLREAARLAGWRFVIHRTTDSPAPTLLRLARFLGAGATGGGWG